MGLKSWVEISGARLVGNLHAVQAVAGPEVEVLAVVKANGYGHDAVPAAEVLTAAGARWFGVSDVDEGARVRAAVGEAARILVMCGFQPEDVGALAEHDLTPVVWTVDHVGAMERASRSAGKRLGVHLEFDTGMSRQGVVRGEELARVLKRMAASKRVFCEGVMTHLSGSEVAGSTVTLAQRERFGAALEQVMASGLKPQWVHLGNSSAVDEGSTMEWVRETARRVGAKPMVRTGLAIYGTCLPVEGGSSALAARLRAVLTWKTRVIGLREIAAGTSVGYGSTFTATRPMRLALLPVGYADGLRREASSGVGDGWVMVGGQKATVVGRVSMNLTVADVTEMGNVRVGDDVVLLGDGVSAEDHARWCGTIPYEVLCGVRARAVVCD